jgi:hypothetical protein
VVNAIAAASARNSIDMIAIATMHKAKPEHGIVE